jgi:hypothetical protein
MLFLKTSIISPFFVYKHTSVLSPLFWLANILNALSLQCWIHSLQWDACFFFFLENLLLSFFFLTNANKFIIKYIHSFIPFNKFNFSYNNEPSNNFATFAEQMKIFLGKTKLWNGIHLAFREWGKLLKLYCFIQLKQQYFTQ